MSTAAISYSSLNDAKNEAKDVAKKLDKYADALHKNVYKKLSKYDGGWSSNLTNASNSVNTKIEELRSAQKDYENYATQIDDLRDECKSVDKAVKSDVSSLTGSFKDRNNIKNSKVQNAISYFFTSVGNSNSGFRWLNSKGDELSMGRDYLKASIKEWYNYEGGKQLLKAIVVIALDAAIAVLGVIAAIATFMAGALTFGAVLVLAAGLVSAAIAFQNIYTNAKNEKAAYEARQNGDPATGYRRSKIDTFTDYLRSSYIFGDDGQTYHYNKTYNAIATGIDIANIACTVVTVVSSLGKLAKNAYKWATGDGAKIKDIQWKQVFSKDTWGKFKGRMKVSFSNFGTDIKNAVKYHDLSFVKDFAVRSFGNIKENLKSEFWEFEPIIDSKGSIDYGALKNSAGSIKNLISIPKNLISDGFTLQNILKEGIVSVGVPAITAFTVNDTGEIVPDEAGRLMFDLFEPVPLSDVTGIIDKTISKIVCPLFEGGSDLEIKGVLEKLSTKSPLDISVPEIVCPDISVMEINIPEIKIPTLVVA